MKPVRLMISLPLVLSTALVGCGPWDANGGGGAGEAVVGRTSAALSAARGAAGDLIADVEVGRRDFTEITLRKALPDHLNNPGGVVIDKSTSPGKAYVWDSGNSRILGLDLGTCYAQPAGTRCTASLVFGQSSGTDRGACNQDASGVQFPHRPAASASTLCGVPESTHTTAEDKSFANMMVDASSNLWVPDVINNRVLKYNTPFTTDTVADAVWGQTSFTGNGCNGATDWISATPGATASLLCFFDPNGGGTGAGVRLDSAGNLWVADGGNNRVVRFPKSGTTIATTADLVLGQSSLTARAAGTGLNQLSSPTALLFDSSGKMYVADAGNHRVMVFAKNASGVFTTGQSGTTFGTFPSDQFGPQTVELDPDGRGVWTSRFQQFASMVELWGWNGQSVSGVPAINISWNSGGSIAFDAQKQLLVSSYIYTQDVERFVKQSDGSYARDKGLFTPPNTQNVTSSDRIDGPGFPGVGVADHTSNPKQLIISDPRLLFWNNPTAVSLGQAPDGCVAPCTVPGPGLPPAPAYQQLKIDASDRVWATNMYQVDVYQAPLTATSTAFKSLNNIPVVGMANTTVNFHWTQVDPNTVDDALVQGLAVTPDGGYLWVAQPGQNRVLRIRGPLTSTPVVDVVLGQTSITANQCNRGGSMGLNTLCSPGAISIDRNGNLFVSDHWLEIAGNLRMLMFAPSTFPATPSSVVFGPSATKEFPTNNPSLSYQFASFEPAFDSTNRMVVGFNPYANQRLPLIGPRYVQYFNNPTQVNPSNPSDPAMALPTGQLEDFYSWPIAATFDSSNNLYVYDANRGRVNIYKTPFAAGPPPSGSIHGQYKNGDPGAPQDSQIKPDFNLVNTTSSAIALTNVTVRYYFSSENTNPTNANFFVDYAAIGSNLVHGRFVAASCGTTNAYLEVSFTGGTLSANGQSGEIQTRFSKPDFSNYDETNDYSYIASQSSYADSSTITVYQSGTRVWGTPPAGCN